RTRGLSCRVRVRRSNRPPHRTVRLLFDENLSRKLVTKLADLYPGSIHAAHAGLLEKPDATIWDYARSSNRLLVSADADFYELATALGSPPRTDIAPSLEAPDQGCGKPSAP